MAAGECFKASIICEGDDGTAYVFDYGFADTDGQVHIDTGIAAGNFQTLVQNYYVAALPTDVTIKKYRFACVNGAHKGEIGFVNDVNVAGEASAVNRYPNEIAISMRRSTGYASRRDRGRVFFGPVSAIWGNNANVNKVDLTAPALQDLRDLGKATLATQGAGLFPVILAANGTYNGRIIVRVDIAEVFVHHKTRRPRVGA